MAVPGRLRREKDTAVTAHPQLMRVPRREHKCMNVCMDRAADVGRDQADVRAADGDLATIEGTRPFPLGENSPTAHVDAIDVIRRDSDRHRIPAIATREAGGSARRTPVSIRNIQPVYAPVLIKSIKDIRIVRLYGQADPSHSGWSAGASLRPGVAVRRGVHRASCGGSIKGGHSAGLRRDDTCDRSLQGKIRKRLLYPMESTRAIWFAAVDALTAASHETIRVPWIHRQGIEAASGPGKPAGERLRVPCVASVERDDRTNAKIRAASALAGADKDPVGVGRIDGDRSNRQRVRAQVAQHGVCRIAIKGIHQGTPCLAGIIRAPDPAVRRADIDACPARRHRDGGRPPAHCRLDTSLPLSQDRGTDRNPVVRRRGDRCLPRGKRGSFFRAARAQFLRTALAKVIECLPALFGQIRPGLASGFILRLVGRQGDGNSCRFCLGNEPCLRSRTGLADPLA